MLFSAVYFFWGISAIHCHLPLCIYELLVQFITCVLVRCLCLCGAGAPSPSSVVPGVSPPLRVSGSRATPTVSRVGRYVCAALLLSASPRHLRDPASPLNSSGPVAAAVAAAPVAATTASPRLWTSSVSPRLRRSGRRLTSVAPRLCGAGGAPRQLCLLISTSSCVIRVLGEIPRSARPVRRLSPQSPSCPSACVRVFDPAVPMSFLLLNQP